VMMPSAASPSVGSRTSSVSVLYPKATGTISGIP
jgi:hypothetical protein